MTVLVGRKMILCCSNAMLYILKHINKSLLIPFLQNLHYNNFSRKTFNIPLKFYFISQRLYQVISYLGTLLRGFHFRS
jgi:hypothetical protein